MKKRNQQGFTLIELMIVIAIIAILMSYALPAYRDYTVRAKVGEGLQLASAVKAAVSETMMDTGAFPANNAAAGVAAAGDISGKNVQQILVQADGVVQITYSGGAPLGGATATLTPETEAGSVIWTCDTSLDAKYEPSECRPAAAP